MKKFLSKDTKEAYKKELIKDKFSKKVSPAVVEDLLKHASSNTLEIREKEITILLDKKNIVSDKDDISEPSSLIDNLKTIPGVADKTIAAILGECGDLRRFSSAKAFIGYLGLYPTQYQSGNSNSVGRLAKRGIPIAKHALYMAAVGSVLHNTQLNKLFHDKVSAGKSKKEALIIISKKIATIMYSIVIYNKPYDAQRVFIPKR